MDKPKILTTEEINAEFKLRVKLIYNMYQQRVFDYQKFQDAITQYYKKPQEVLTKFGVV